MSSSVLVARRAAAQEVDDRRDLRVAGDLRPREILGLRAVDAGAVGHVHRHDAGQRRAVEQHVAGGGGELGLAEGLDLARRHLDAMLEGLGEDRAVRVHAAELEHQRHRLHRVVARAAELERGAGARGDVAVARGVHDDLRAQRLPPALALADHARDAPVLHQRRRDERVEPQLRARLGEHREEAVLEPVRVDRLAQRGVVRVLRALEDLLVDAAAGVAGPVAHEAGRGDAADDARLLDEAGLRAEARRAHGGGDAGGAAARDEHVVGAGDGGFEDFAEDFAHFRSIV